MRDIPIPEIFFRYSRTYAVFARKPRSPSTNWWILKVFAPILLLEGLLPIGWQTHPSERLLTKCGRKVP